MSESETPITQPPSKIEIINEIAKTLAERRRARGLTLEKVFQNIKIRIPYLESIEKGRWDELPGDVYIRGFIKRYADHLGLDGEKLLAPYFQSDKEAEKKSNEIPILKGAEITRTQLIGVALAAIVVVIIIQLIKRSGEKQIVSYKEPPMVVSTMTVGAAAVVPSSPVHGEQHLLEVYTPLSLWLRVSSKDKAFEGFIPQGTTWTWKGEGVFTVRFGHTRELSVHFDGRPVVIQDNQKKIELPVVQ